MRVNSILSCTHVGASVYLIGCLHSDQIVVMCILFVHLRHFFHNCWRIARQTWRVFQRELERIGIQILYLNLALEGDSEHPDARCGRVTIKIRTFNETITKWSVLDQAVLSRQLSNDSAAEKYGNCFVGAEESRLHAIVGCLKLAASVCWSPKVDLREREREIMLFIGKPKGRSMMISKSRLSLCWNLWLRHPRNGLAYLRVKRTFGCDIWRSQLHPPRGLAWYDCMLPPVGALDRCQRIILWFRQIEILQHRVFANSKSLCQWKWQIASEAQVETHEFW